VKIKGQSKEEKHQKHFELVTDDEKIRSLSIYTEFVNLIRVQSTASNEQYQNHVHKCQTPATTT